MTADNLDKRYRVTLCVTCSHPAGRHVGQRQGYPCDLCSCTAWVEGDSGWWSDRATTDALARHRASRQKSAADPGEPT